MSIYDLHHTQLALHKAIEERDAARRARDHFETALAEAQAHVLELRKALMTYGLHCMRAGFSIKIMTGYASDFERRVLEICKTPLARESGAEELRELMFKAAQLVNTGMVSDEALRDEINALLKGKK
jgi:hypothetical protein